MTSEPDVVRNLTHPARGSWKRDNPRVSATLRLADLIAGLSIACDLGFGLPPEEAMRSCLIATGLARNLGLPEDEVADAYYTALLMHVGCSALSHETAMVFGDERPVLTAVASTNVADPVDISENLMPILLQVESPDVRAQVEHFAATDQGEFGRNFDTGSCEIASATARRVGLGTGAERSLKEAVEWWNGDGPPQGLKGDEIAPAARIARAAADAARFDALGGKDAVVEAVRRHGRAGFSTLRSSTRSSSTRTSSWPRRGRAIRATECWRSSPSPSSKPLSPT